MQVSVYRRLVNRSDFAASVDGKIRTALTHAFDQVALSKLPTDASGAYQVDVPVNPVVEKPGVGLLSVQVPGVYPVQVVTLDRSNHILARLTTHLLYTGKPTVKQSPLDVALVAPVRAAACDQPAGKPARVSEPSPPPWPPRPTTLAAHAAVPVTIARHARDPRAARQPGTDVDKATLAKLAGDGRGQSGRVVAGALRQRATWRP